MPSTRPGSRPAAATFPPAALAATARLPTLAPALALAQLACVCHHVPMPTVFLNLQSEVENSNQLMLVSLVLLQP